MRDLSKIRVTKLEAAQRQLNCAIELWFRDGDQISTHALARAAYDLIHDLNEKSGMPRDLFYNTDMIKDEYQKQWRKVLKEPGNFIKHADRDPDGTVEIAPFVTLAFMSYSIRGLVSLGAKPTVQTTALGFWLALHDPELVKQGFRKLIEDRIPIEHRVQLSDLSREKFFEYITQNFGHLFGAT